MRKCVLLQVIFFHSFFKNNWIIILEFSFVWRLTKIQIFCTLQLNNNFSILLQNDELITSLLIIFVFVRFGCPCPPAWLCVVGVDWGSVRHLEDVILLTRQPHSKVTRGKGRRRKHFQHFYLLLPFAPK